MLNSLLSGICHCAEFVTASYGDGGAICVGRQTQVDGVSCEGLGGGDGCQFTASLSLSLSLPPPPPPLPPLSLSRNDLSLSRNDLPLSERPLSLSKRPLSLSLSERPLCLSPHMHIKIYTDKYATRRKDFSVDHQT